MLLLYAAATQLSLIGREEKLKLQGLVILSAACALAACGSGGASGGGRSEMRIVGSSTVYPFTVAVAEAFSRAHPTFRAAVVESTGTGAGMKLFCAGVGSRHPDIENASRRMKRSEFEDCRKNGVTEIVEVPIGIDGLALIESRSGAKNYQLTVEDVYKALAATPYGRPNTARTWRDVNPRLPAVAIQVYGPPPTSGTRDSFAELILEKGCDVNPEMKALKEQDKDRHKDVCTKIREDGAYVEAGENDNLLMQKVAAAPGAVAQGGAAALPPVKVGIVLTGVSNADQFGVSLGNTYEEKDVYDAIVAGLNAQGGLAGRRIVPVYAKTDTASNNWEVDFATACATFTQDDKVDVVLGYVFNYFASFEACLAKKGIPHLTTSFNIPDAQELNSFPLMFALSTPTIERRALAKIDGAVATGYLTKTSKIGIISDTCPGTDRSLRGVVLPALKRAGLTVGATAQLNCVNGASGNGGAVSALQNAVLAFRSNGVDRVMIHGVSEGPPLLLFATSAESQGYRPGYVMSSLAQLAILGGQMPREQTRNVRGFGWLETQDVPPRAYAKPNALQSRCLGILLERDIKPTAAADYAFAYNLCEAAFVYEAALQKSEGRSDGPAVKAAVEGLGRTSSTFNLGGSAFSADRDDAVTVARPLVWRESCGCHEYQGSARPIPVR